MTIAAITGTEIADVATKLDGLDGLTSRDREVLAAVFGLAGQAAADHADDVSGFMPVAVESVLTLNPSKLPASLLPAVQRGQLLAGFRAGFCDGSV